MKPAMTPLVRPHPAHLAGGRPTRLGKPRASLVVYRVDPDGVRFLLISSRRNPDKLTLPGGKVGATEAAASAAMRETLEEAGVSTHPPVGMGSYLHRKRRGRVHPTDTFLASYAGSKASAEDRQVLWLTREELALKHFRIRKPIRKQLTRAALMLADRAEAA